MPKSLSWIWNANNPIINSHEQFTSHVSEVFSTATGTLTTSDQLFRLRQGSSSVNDYTLHFRMLAATSGWNEVALLGAYWQGLNPDIRAAMALYDDSIGLESFLQRTTRVSQWLAACQPPVTATQSASVAASFPVPEPMQVDSTRLSHTERNRRIMQGLSCGQQGHHICNCPIKPPCPVVSSSGNFISQECLNQLQLSHHHHHQVYSVKTIQGKPLGRGKVRHSSPYITLQVGLFHKEDIKFLVLEESTMIIILGRPWLHLHRPELRWDPCDITRWSSTCYTQCLSKLDPPSVPALMASTHVESPEPAFTPEIPAEYMAFQDVFRKQPPIYNTSSAMGLCYRLAKDGGLRPCIDYRQLNSQIQLDLRSAYNLIRICAGDKWKTAFVTPTGHYEYEVMPYGLSISPSVFQTFMNEVFREFLHQFVVVYIDDILIYSRNMAEHRQHIQQVLHKLCQHHLYLKPEKCEFHKPSVQFLGYIISAEGVQMDQGKIHAIQHWPQPNSIKNLQCFLGFSNFYRRIIKDYNSITAKLTSLLRGKPKHLIWSPAAHEAFQHLKHIFSTAPLLHHPDPELPFTVKVDASTTGVGAVLSQVVGEPPVLHPCAFYSQGAVHPFTTITDHKNLQYLREAKRLNPRQARWALFLTCFNFKITYRPNSKNIPADALSRRSSSEPNSDPKPIIPPNLIVSPIIWNLDQDIQQATLQEPAPPECPEGKIYGPLPTSDPPGHGSPISGLWTSRQQADPLASSVSLLVAQYAP
ncbi:Transposon Tf2-8 polyprotein [Labeo rohita]|uniref:Transposon Tf2-8 polyprotein n=1 Tax=Labeo rohita TaxID=84645 RepID=A0ABQ8LDA5_LABRO|nr:Transposon Tf2-8 polyprotein [Labeo rohita]